MINIRNILSDLYADRSVEDLYAWLDSMELMEPIKRTISQLNFTIEHEKELIKTCKMLPVGHIATNLLLTVNNRIGREGSPDKLKELENTISDICLAILVAFLNTIRSNQIPIWTQIIHALKHTCNFYNYDFVRLIQVLKIDSAASYFQSQKSADKVIFPTTIPSLCWKGKPEQLKDFLDIFVDQRMVKSRKGLSKLFDNPTQSLQLQFDPVPAELVIQFLHNIKKSKLVTYAGCKGFYGVFEFHILGFKKEFLKEKEAGKHINALNQKNQWKKNQPRMESWLQPFLGS